MRNTTVVRNYYDLGDWNLGDWNEDKCIRMGDVSLAKILRAIIKCHGAITSSCEFDGHYKNKNMNTVVFRVKLAEDKKQLFEEMTGFKLTKPEVVTGQEVTGMEIE